MYGRNKIYIKKLVRLFAVKLSYKVTQISSTSENNFQTKTNSHKYLWGVYTKAKHVCVTIRPTIAALKFSNHVQCGCYMFEKLMEITDYGLFRKVW